MLLLGEVTDRLSVGHIAGRIIQSLHELVEIKGEQVQAGCSIGISFYPSDGDTFELLVSRADKALYRAKRRGRGKYRFFRHELDLDRVT